MVDFKPEGAFQGYIFAKLEDMPKRFDNIEKEVKVLTIKVDAHSKSLANMKGWAAGIGAGFGFLTAMVKDRVIHLFKGG